LLPNIEDIGRHIHDINRRNVFHHRKRIYVIDEEIDVFHKTQLDQNLVADIKVIPGLKMMIAFTSIITLGEMMQ